MLLGIGVVAANTLQTSALTPRSLQLGEPDGQLSSEYNIMQWIFIPDDSGHSMCTAGRKHNLIYHSPGGLPGGDIFDVYTGLLSKNALKFY